MDIYVDKTFKMADENLPALPKQLLSYFVYFDPNQIFTDIFTKHASNKFQAELDDLDTAIAQLSADLLIDTNSKISVYPSCTI